MHCSPHSPWLRSPASLALPRRRRRHVDGGRGDDRITGGPGRNRLHGGPGRNTVIPLLKRDSNDWNIYVNVTYDLPVGTRVTWRPDYPSANCISWFEEGEYSDVVANSDPKASACSAPGQAAWSGTRASGSAPGARMPSRRSCPAAPDTSATSVS
ncbi:hypothetical protein [Conexibacter stalactiti]|uniref:hypothetical protein n=1 Tax=Conexibacter stalactiti TaxID=1940611 RepID=UPI00384FCEBF